MENVNSAADSTLDFTVGITNAGAGAVMYYDHWEDGFEPDLTNPGSQRPPQVWGDGVAGQRQRRRRSARLVPATCCRRVQSSCSATSSRRPATRARSAGTGATVSRRREASRSRPAASRTRSARCSPPRRRRTTRRSGEPTTGSRSARTCRRSRAPATPFGTSSLQIMAGRGRNVGERRQARRRHDDRRSATINRGEVVYVDGGVRAGGARHCRTSPSRSTSRRGDDVGSAYELRWFTLFPTPLLTSDYLNPVGSSRRQPAHDHVSVQPEHVGDHRHGDLHRRAPATLTVPGRRQGRLSFASPLGQAVRFQSVGGEPFVAVGAGGSQSGAAPGSAGDGSCNVYDWGFGLVPTSLLTTKAVLGWAPGNSTNPPNGAGDRDDDPVWISTLDRHHPVHRLRRQPGDRGARSRSCDGNYDEQRARARLHVDRIFDVDGDMTGAAIYTCDGTKIAGAWGEDPSTAPTGRSRVRRRLRADPVDGDDRRQDGAGTADRRQRRRTDRPRRHARRTTCRSPTPAPSPSPTSRSTTRSRPAPRTCRTRPPTTIGTGVPTPFADDRRSTCGDRVPVRRGRRRLGADRSGHHRSHSLPGADRHAVPGWHDDHQLRRRRRRRESTAATRSSPI